MVAYHTGIIAEMPFCIPMTVEDGYNINCNTFTYPGGGTMQYPHFRTLWFIQVEVCIQHSHYIHFPHTLCTLQPVRYPY